MTFFARKTLILYLLVVADVEREGDDVPGDVGREARESLRGEFRSELLPTGLLVGREAAGRGDLKQVGVSSVGRDRGARSDGVGAASQNAWNIAKSSGCRFLA